jgi:hypothetical protein
MTEIIFNKLFDQCQYYREQIRFYEQKIQEIVMNSTNEEKRNFIESKKCFDDIKIGNIVHIYYKKEDDDYYKLHYDVIEYKFNKKENIVIVKLHPNQDLSLQQEPDCDIYMKWDLNKTIPLSISDPLSWEITSHKDALIHPFIGTSCVCGKSCSGENSVESLRFN